ncbi:restriction endonuclease subunit S [Paraferrimonas haliotis]|uniref:Type I restriction modification DNA specificity domain-containing protein n=1 Tax=Paraferrimonas haliotis TaxID=2013866 RepID=A0AA37TUF0_9GAMM|nr:restriction endonuclease subunit S [Paraferrimonas haliotis]GLS84687.1 hypothetical protein GCM10007894_26640 [Paraferrimonas haliotis]
MSFDWEYKTINEIATLNQDSYKKSDNWKSVTYLDTANLTENKIGEYLHFDLLNDKLPSRAKRKVKIGDILYSTVRPNQKHYGLVQGDIDDLLVSTGFTVIRSNPEKCDNNFLYWWITQEQITNYLQAVGEDSTSAYPAIKPLDIGKLEIGLPPLPIQKKIAKILGDLDKKIALNTQTNETLEAMAQAIFKSWFVDFDPVKSKMAGEAPKGMDTATAALFPNKLTDSELGLIPEGWEVSEIGNELTVAGGGTPSKKNDDFWEGGIHHWTSPKDLSGVKDKVLLDTASKVTDLGLEKISSGLLPVDTVLLSSRAPVGYLALAKIPTAINQGYIAMKCEKALTSEFVLQWCTHRMDEIKSRASGSTFAEISKKNFKPIPVVVPNNDLVKEFTKIAKSLYDSITQNVKQTQELTKLRDTLLPKLLSGELDLSQVEAEVS